MTDAGATASSTLDETSHPHDHAWRKARSEDEECLLVGSYCCDLCSATWSM